MRTVFDVKRELDPLTMWKAVEKQAEVNRMEYRAKVEAERRAESSKIVMLREFLTKRT